MGLLHRETTQIVLASFFDVYNELGYGFLEAVYCRALELEMKRRGVPARREVPIRVWYKDAEVGFYRADILVDERVLIEVKASRKLEESAYAQLLHYLKATRLDLGLLLHFGPKPIFKRIVATTASRRAQNDPR